MPKVKAIIATINFLLLPHMAQRRRQRIAKTIQNYCQCLSMERYASEDVLPERYIANNDMSGTRGRPDLKMEEQGYSLTGVCLSKTLTI